jgi:DNA-binding winged helix-turn-helix (wHTH) protein
VHIRRLRKHLGPYSEQYIETIFGIGYRFHPLRTNWRLQSSASVSEIALTA